MFLQLTVSHQYVQGRLEAPPPHHLSAGPCFANSRVTADCAEQETGACYRQDPVTAP